MIDNDLIVGWKALAAYFHRSEKTLRRWTKRYDLPVVKLGRSIYCSKIGIAFHFEKQASYQRAKLAAVAATRRGASAETMNDFAREQMGATIRAGLAARISNG
jgi:hypothetical protein